MESEMDFLHYVTFKWFSLSFEWSDSYIKHWLFRKYWFTELCRYSKCWYNLWHYCSCSFTKLCLILCDPVDCSMPGFPVLYYLQSLLKFMSIESMMPSISSSVSPFSSCPQSFPISGSFPKSALSIRCQSIEPQLQYQSSQWIFRVDFL